MPLNEVAGVRFPRGDDTSTTVVMLSDSIAARRTKFAVETSWGSARRLTVKACRVDDDGSGLAWQSVDVLSGKR
ncbi:MAG: hypothetical protein U0930_02175 [Pirellulales bacterium]